METRGQNANEIRKVARNTGAWRRLSAGGVNQAHAKVADDSLLSPRLGAIYDAFGNGRLRFNASYSGTNTAPTTFYVNGTRCN